MGLLLIRSYWPEEAKKKKTHILDIIDIIILLDHDLSDYNFWICLIL